MIWEYYLLPSPHSSKKKHHIKTMATSFLDTEQFIDDVISEIRSYQKLISFIKSKLDRPASIDLMIGQYLNYMDRINTHNPIQANDSIKLMWRMHLLHPQIYRQDCFNKFGRLILPNDLSYSFYTEQTLHHTSSIHGLVSSPFDNIMDSL